MKQGQGATFAANLPKIQPEPDFVEALPVRVVSHGDILQVYFYNFALITIHGLKRQKFVRVCPRFQIRELDSGRMNR